MRFQVCIASHAKRQGRWIESFEFRLPLEKKKRNRNSTSSQGDGSHGELFPLFTVGRGQVPSLAAVLHIREQHTSLFGRKLMPTHSADGNSLSILARMKLFLFLQQTSILLLFSVFQPPPASSHLTDKCVLSFSGWILTAMRLLSHHICPVALKMKRWWGHDHPIFSLPGYQL